jgi:hypothetical protein
MPRTKMFYFTYQASYYSIKPVDWFKLVKVIIDSGKIPDYLFTFGALELEYPPRQRHGLEALELYLPKRPK